MPLLDATYGRLLGAMVILSSPAELTVRIPQTKIRLLALTLRQDLLHGTDSPVIQPDVDVSKLNSPVSI